MIEIIQSVGWTDIVAGTIFAAAIGLVSSLVRFYFTRTSVLQRKGVWYSAEYDPKGTPQNPVTYLKVSIKPSFWGYVKIQSIEILNQDEKVVETGWVVKGRIQNRILIGEWQTVIENTDRFGSVMLYFLDNGRAVGYWLGSLGGNTPIYGYWIMSKDFDDLKSLVKEVEDRGFQMVNVAKIITDAELPPE